MDLMAFYNTLLPMVTGNLNASNVAAIVITGLCVVFLGLIILILFVWAYGKFFSRKKEPKGPAAETPKAEPAKPVSTVSRAEPASDDDEIIAVIAAAVAAMSEADGKNYRLRSVRAAKNRSSRSAWSLAGLQNNTNPF
ncbi:MAG: OadG family protein [Porcipelethomonas sp.]